MLLKKKKMERAKKAAGEEPIFELIPFKKMKAAIVNTGNEVFYGRIKDTFTPVIIEKLKEYGAEVVGHVVSDDNHEHITAAIQKFLDEGVDMVLCTGGMSVDPDDRTPLAIKNTGAEIVTTEHLYFREPCSCCPTMERKKTRHWSSGMRYVCETDYFLIWFCHESWLERF